MTPEKKKDLRLFAIRVRESILKSIQSTKSGRPGGSLSAADYFTYLYQNELRIDPTQPRDENRDRFVFPRGMLPSPYATLALSDFFSEENLLRLRHIAAHLQGHPNMNTTPQRGDVHRLFRTGGGCWHGERLQAFGQGAAGLYPAG